MIFAKIDRGIAQISTSCSVTAIAAAILLQRQTQAVPTIAMFLADRAV